MNLKRPPQRRFLTAAMPIFVSLCLHSVCLFSSAAGQDLREAAPKKDLINDLAASHPASAYIDQSTLLVAEVDWNKIDIDAFFVAIQNLTGDRPSDAPMVKELADTLKRSQAGKIYVIAGLQSFSTGIPLIAIPTPEPQRLVELIQEVVGKSDFIAAIRSTVLLGDPNQIRGLESFTPVERDELLAPLHDAGRLDHTAVLSVPQLTRKMLANLWPNQEPSGFPIKVSPSQLVRDIKRLVVTLRTPPNPLIRLVIDTVDDQAADRVSNTFADLKRHYGEFLAEVTIKRDRQQITLEADQNVIADFESIAMNARDNDRRTELVNTLKTLGVAFYNYESREKHLPPRCFVDPKGDPLHSWLVAVLPDFNNLAFYRQLKLDRPWNHPANARLQNTMPKGIGDQRLAVAHTTIRAPVFPGSLWHGDGPPKKLKEITDGTAHTIMLIDAPTDASVHWADPTPWVISETDPISDIFGDREQAYALLADGAVILLKRDDLDSKQLKAMLTISAGD